MHLRAVFDVNMNLLFLMKWVRNIAESQLPVSTAEMRAFPNTGPLDFSDPQILKSGCDSVLQANKLSSTE